MHQPTVQAERLQITPLGCGGQQEGATRFSAQPPAPSNLAVSENTPGCSLLPNLDKPTPEEGCQAVPLASA